MWPCFLVLRLAPLCVCLKMCHGHWNSLYSWMEDWGRGGEIKERREEGGREERRDGRREGRIEGGEMKGGVMEGVSEGDEWMRVNVWVGVLRKTVCILLLFQLDTVSPVQWPNVVRNSRCQSIPIGSNDYCVSDTTSHANHEWSRGSFTVQP